ncbi:unnamed protein product, partial [Brugia pahangi]|uniref:Astacin domain-containing protein n=1 Tax=Brugia pahangi TaxID=6280 RepID=A0A0N4TDK5_BRUPA
MLREFLLIPIGMILIILWIISLRPSIENVNIQRSFSQQIQAKDFFNATTTKVNMEELLLLDRAETVKRKYVVTVNRSSDKHWDTSCKAIRQRGFYPEMPFSSAEKNFPIAFIRIVYKVRHRPIGLIIFGSVTYTLSVTDYCNAVILSHITVAGFSFARTSFQFNVCTTKFLLLYAKSTPLFHSQMRNLSKCFPNVLLTEREYEVDSAGHNMSRSFLECLRV